MNGAAPRWLCAAWPGFLAACVLEGLVFAGIDPLDLHWLGDPLHRSRQAVYAVAFFGFWAVCTAACWLALVLGSVPADASS